MDIDKIRTLLIIDDEKDMCLLLRRALRTFFGHIEFAHTLSEGAAIAATISPDVILLDNNLPDGYGINHINTFRNDDKAVQIVMVSAMDIRYESLAAGADEFIGKPVDMAELKSIIDTDNSGEN
jgi:DNA-binding response OmpR family regulator